jgi:hypothetical protein
MMQSISRLAALWIASLALAMTAENVQGWAKRLVRRSSKSEGGSVPTVKLAMRMEGGHGAMRLCPPYGFCA